MAKGGILMGLANLSAWAAAYIAVGTITYPFWMQVQGFISGQGNGNNGGNNQGGMI
jgi:hypothetical protein